MHYVYLLRSRHFQNRTYIGRTANIENRLQAHNEGRSPHTSKYKPWKIITYVAFSDENKSAAFERYLKSGSGRAFSRRRLW